MLGLFKDKTENIGILPRIQVKLYRNGRYVPFTSWGSMSLIYMCQCALQFQFWGTTDGN
jgi:hypothetical protein